MLQLDYPDHTIKITQINDKNIDTTTIDTLSALEYIKIKGQIESITGDKLTSFNGLLFAELYDRISQRITVGQESTPTHYAVRENKLFRGKVSVINGTFEFDFIMPKNISYAFENGRFIFYGQSDEGQDATGFFSNVQLGETAPNANIENDPPQINTYINNNLFQDGNTVGKNSMLISEIKDFSGINITGSGFNQDITLTLNDAVFVLNDYYTAALDDYQKGFIMYPLRDLAPGPYTATIKVRDIHNNLATDRVTFSVTDKPSINIYDAKIYPNPAKEFVALSFNHDRVGDNIDIDISIYNLQGTKLLTKHFEIEQSHQNVNNIRIDLPESIFRQELYLYHMKIISRNDNAVGEKTSRLIIIN